MAGNGIYIGGEKIGGGVTPTPNYNLVNDTDEVINLVNVTCDSNSQITSTSGSIMPKNNYNNLKTISLEINLSTDIYLCDDVLFTNLTQTSFTSSMVSNITIENFATLYLSSYGTAEESNDGSVTFSASSIGILVSLVTGKPQDSQNQSWIHGFKGTLKYNNKYVCFKQSVIDSWNSTSTTKTVFASSVGTQPTTNVIYSGTTLSIFKYSNPSTSTLISNTVGKTRTIVANLTNNYQLPTSYSPTTTTSKSDNIVPINLPTYFIVSAGSSANDESSTIDGVTLYLPKKVEINGVKRQNYYETITYSGRGRIVKV